MGSERYCLCSSHGAYSTDLHIVTTRSYLRYLPTIVKAPRGQELGPAHLHGPLPCLAQALWRQTVREGLLVWVMERQHCKFQGGLETGPGISQPGSAAEDLMAHRSD